MSQSERIRIATEAALRWIGTYRDIQQRQINAIVDGDELGQRRGQRDIVQALVFADELADYVASFRVLP